MNTTTTNETAPAWAIVELMGHVRYGGLISKDNQFGTAMLRVDVPQADGQFMTQLINPSSIYRITLAAEELAREAAKLGEPKPMGQWELRHLLPEPKESAHESSDSGQLHDDDDET